MALCNVNAIRIAIIAYKTDWMMLTRNNLIKVVFLIFIRNCKSIAFIWQSSTPWLCIWVRIVLFVDKRLLRFLFVRLVLIKHSFSSPLLLLLACHFALISRGFFMERIEMEDHFLGCWISIWGFLLRRSWCYRWGTVGFHLS